MSRPRILTSKLRSISPLPRLAGGRKEEEWNPEGSPSPLNLIPGSGPAQSPPSSSSSFLNSRFFQILYSKVVEIITHINGLLSFGDGTDGAWSGDMNGQYRVVTVPTAGVSYRVEHGLGRIPAFAYVQPGGATVVYFDDPDLASWTSTEIYLKVNVAPVKIKLLIV